MNWVMSNDNKWSSLRNLFTDVVFDWAFLFMPFGGVSSCILLCDVFFSKDLQAPSFYLFFSAQMARFSFLARSQYVSSLFRFIESIRKYGLLFIFTWMVSRCGIWGYRRDAERSGGSSVTWIKLQGKFDEKLWEWFIPSSCQIELKR